MNETVSAAAVVPVFNPEPGLEKLCRDLAGRFALVVAVDDGSAEHTEDFARLPEGVVLLRHEVNRGKGRAIKTAFAWLAANRPDVRAAVFVDGDGQHRPDDALAAVRKCLAEDAVTLGVRDFSGSVPFRSIFGNVCTSWLVKTFLGFPVRDTQTGLRAVPARLFAAMQDLPGERYEYEMRLFGFLRRTGEPLAQVPIRTIYIENNRASHFNPIKDTIRIYRGLFDDFFWRESAAVCLRRLALFAVSSLASFGMDIGCFCLLYDHVFGPGHAGRLILAVSLARTVSLVFNFVVNRYVVFRVRPEARTSLGGSFARYLVLAAGIMLASYAFTGLFTMLLGTAKVAWVKAGVDFVLFLVSYLAQKRSVFAKKQGAN